ncbi:hypothetical protein N0M98_09430 [Paenibacillus doosanensis]|uniref:hypothetical protein n=1 Tax=Paenibacillus doosanensis TaxID=1229154 RepID=UPI00218075E4|nr:hypothetical protein [Paenibacillus doosanensis]MCS7460362.1 hypothetical protein [Paenibacillus doosanensis]
MLTIEELSEIEHEEIISARSKYNNFFTNAKEIVEFTNQFLDQYSNKQESYLFFMFYSQMNISLKLAFLSIVRRHDAQTGMNIRYALETAVLAMYALKNPTIEEYYKESGSAEELGKVKKAANNWFDTKYKEFSDNVKNLKVQLSNHMAHANLSQVINSFSLSGREGFETSFFDSEDVDKTKERLRWLGNICLSIIVQIVEISREYPHIQPADGYKEKLIRLALENQRLTEELYHHPKS